MKLLLIEWIDASVIGDQWTELEEAKETANSKIETCLSVGWLVYECRQGTPYHTVYLAMTDGRDVVGPQIEIPVGTIISRREIDGVSMG